MIIRSVEFHCYGPFTNRTFEFRRGLNIVYGPNESGKTTLLDAVAVALYGCDDGRDLQSWGLEGDCRVTMLLEGEGSSVRLDRDLANGRISFLRTDDMYRTLFRFEGIPDADSDDEKARKLAEQLRDIFGLAGADEFRDVLTFRQNSSDLHGGGALSPHILSLCNQSDDLTLSRAVAGIEEEYLQLTRKNPWGEDHEEDGPLQEVQGRLGELEENWYLQQETLKSLSRSRKERAALESEIEIDEDELTKGERFVARLRASHADSAGEGDALERELAEIDERREKLLSLLRRREELIVERDGLNLGENPDHEVPALAAEAEEARKELHELQKMTAELREELIAEGGPSWLFPAGATVGFFALAGALAYWHSELTLAALLSASLLSVFGWMFHFWLLGSKKSEIGAKKERMLALDEQRENAQSRLTEIDARLEAAGLPISARELQEISEPFARHREIEIELRDIDSALGVLEGLEELEERRREVLERMSGQGGAAAPAEDAPCGPESVAEAEERLEEFRGGLNEKKETLAGIRRQEEELLEDVRHIGDIEKEGERLKERETAIRERLAELATARELLCRIDGRHEGGEIEKLAETVGRHAACLTKGRHRQVRIEGGGEILLQARGGKWQPLSRFGRATVDAVGVSVRLALIDIFFHDRQVPLLLDEPLLNLDQKRMDETLKQLEKMAAQHQVILFTHQESLMKKAARVGWNLITLNGKDAKSSTPEDERSKDDEQQLHLL